MRWLLILIAVALLAQTPAPGPQGGGSGGIGVGAANVTSTCVGTVTSCAVTITTLGLTTADTALVQCFNSSTGAARAVTGFTTSGGPPLTTLTPSFTSTTGVICKVNSNGGAGATGSQGITGATGPSGPSGAIGSTGPSGTSGTGTSVTNTFTGSEPNNEISFVHNLNTLNPTFGGCTVGGILVAVGARQNGFNAWFIHATTPGTYVCTFSSGTVSGGTPTGPAGGGLTGTYPNPTVASVSAAVTIAGFSGSCSSSTVLVGDGTCGAISSSFSAVTPGTNTGALTMGTGGSLGVSGSGTINATSLGGVAAANYAVLTGAQSFSGLQSFPAGISVFGAVGSFFSGVATGSVNNPFAGIGIQNQNSSAAIDQVTLASGTMSSTTGKNTAISITPTYNQASGNSANTDIFLNRTQTAVGSGAQLLMDLQVGTVSKFKIDNTGLVTIVPSTFIFNGHTCSIVSTVVTCP